MDEDVLLYRRETSLTLPEARVAGDQLLEGFVPPRCEV
jgi:hypothetical protein